MTNAPVRDAVYAAGMAPKNNTAKNTEGTKSDSRDFGKVMNEVKTQAKQTVQQSDNKMTEKQTASQTQTKTKTETKTEEASKQETTAKSAPKKETAKSSVSEETKSVSENKPLDKNTEAAVEDAVKEVMEEVEDALGVSEEELLAVMQQLGLFPLDILNPDNMANLMAALMGEESTIQLVMNEDMYATLQDLMKLTDGAAQELLSATGLSEEELEAVMEQMKALAGQQTVITEDGQQDAFQLLPEQQEMPDLTEIPAEEGTIPVVVVKDDTQTGEQTVQETQAPEEIVVEKEEHTQQEEKTGKDDSSFMEQQQNMQSFQNMDDKLAGLVEGSEGFSAQLPNTESILKQLVDFVKIQNGERLTEMELQLHPASLGNVRVTLSSKGGVVTAQLMTENETVKNAIESQVSQLRLNLEEQGIKVEAIEVSVASHQMERNLEQNEDRQSREQTDKTEEIRKARRTSINLNSYENEDELIEELSESDDAARIAMEMMAIGGNRMDLLA